MILPLALDRNYSVIDYRFCFILCGASSKWIVHITNVLPIEISPLIIVVVMIKARKYLYKVRQFDCIF